MSSTLHDLVESRVEVQGDFAIEDLQALETNNGTGVAKFYVNLGIVSLLCVILKAKTKSSKYRLYLPSETTDWRFNQTSVIISDDLRKRITATALEQCADHGLIPVAASQ